MTAPPRQLLGQSLPNEWDVVSLRWLSRRFAGGTPDKSASSYWENGTIPWLNSGTVNQGVIQTPSEHITEEGFANSSAKWIPKGSLVMALAGQGKTKAMVGYLGIETTGNQSLGAIVPDAIEGKFLYWWLTSQYRHIRNLSSQDGRDGLNLEMIGSIKCPVPPVQNQTRIAAFLDEKTAQIDALIEKKQALLDRLAEKRQAVITQAATEGLNRDVPMKDSGIDWLGQIPEHWQVKPLKRIVDYQEGPGVMAVDFRDEGVPLLRIASVGKRWATLEGVNYLDPQMVQKKWSHFLTAAGDLLISASATSGIVSEVDAETEGCVPYTGIIKIKPVIDQSVSSFLRHFLVSQPFVVQIEQLRAGSTIQHFGPYHLGLMVIAVPPLEEQAAISKHLDAKLEALGTAEDRLNDSVRTLMEYRASLITSAVTGQLELPQ